MSKPIIAVDIDDVIADSTEHLRKQANKMAGANLQPEHYKVPGPYWGYYESIWKEHGIDHLLSFDKLDPEMVEDQSHVELIKDAKDVLHKLAKNYRLVVVTSRELSWEPATKRWLASHFPDTFDGMYFAGHDKAGPQTKGELCKEVGAKWLIDDNIEHAHTALDQDIEVVLFGSYGWHHGREVRKGVVRCKDWAAVQEYFDERAS